MQIQETIESDKEEHLTELLDGYFAEYPPQGYGTVVKKIWSAKDEYDVLIYYALVERASNCD